ncbi:MAG: Asp-tRNA(Asn)/Glu-tRNA(Gln) amidotransferase subunit GatC [Kiloniellaceae bacterium]|jgi:aspartyl-tRNA(Asn)/glutamyl-tRNA(Gln) amidotransferase subunit C|uniref:Asp-tRNA(Asn)/Glu-tRNA(Gln) amidotransferase subunit GatC n=1 Tax=Pelagibius sp. 7325 TaxID=3131994 RepID=UPI0030ED148C
MSVDKETVAKIARLARVRVDESHEEALAKELSNILGWIEQLSELDTDGVEPMTSVVSMQLPLRDDKVTDGGYPDKVTANAPEAAHGFYAVPKVVE